ncbi:hypothetical protein [Nocardioides sp. InS609-2]|uniref:hypothetical protein n=1 Tax=Nocardioides sp. InS609-2 TaxID=2760705 RepID=UPI0020BF697A|nr:hypothetical protein [Nocardioides sp. InS609-2]
MSERGLVVHQGSLSDIETAMATATQAVTNHLISLLDTVNAQTPTWTYETPSRIAQQEQEQRLRDGITRLTDALDSIKAAVATYREDAQEIEIENVAIVG